MKTSTKIKIFWVILTVVFILIIFKYRDIAAEIILPLILSIVLCYLLLPLIDLYKFIFKKFKINEKYAVYAAMITFTLLIALILFKLIPNILSEMKNLLEKFSNYSIDLDSILDKFNFNDSSKNFIKEYAKKARSYLSSSLNDILLFLMNGLMGLFSKITTILVTPVLSFYILRDKDKIKESFLKSLSIKTEENVGHLLRLINEGLTEFFKGQLTVSLIIGILTTLALMVLKIDYALILGIVNGFFNIVPYFGPIIGAVPIIIIVVAINYKKAIIVAVTLFLIQQIESTFITPKIIGNKTGFHPVIIILSIFTGGKLGGVFGMFLSIPTLAVIKAIYNFLYLKILEI